MAVTDVLSVLAAMALALFARFGTSRPSADFIFTMAVAPPLFVPLFAGYRLYRVHEIGPAEEFRRILSAVSVGVMAIVIASFWSHAELSRLWIALLWVFALVLVLLTRRTWRYVIGQRKWKGEFTFRTLIVGTNAEAAHLTQVLQSHPFGFQPIGFVGVDERREGADLDGLPVLGGLDELRQTIGAVGAECVFVASSALQQEQISEVTRVTRDLSVQVRVSANLPEILLTRLSVQAFGGVTTLSLRQARLSGMQSAIKRAFDICLSTALLVLTLPLWLVIALLVRITSPGPVLFRQQRIGRRGVPFTMLKFRTMVQDAEDMLPRVVDLNEASGPLFKVRDDPRVTRLGRRLRRFSFDELPQLVNVLKGEMSLVGPRPPLPHEVDRYEDWQMERLQVPPGITGLWQVSGRSELDFEDYLRLDLFYVENWSPAYDLFILAKTVPVLLTGRGAF